ncbi:putative cyclin-D6-1 [Nymphaea thermarum]|nr:putative cyclin-D6-1 [Nymphaea thermarum]
MEFNLDCPIMFSEEESECESGSVARLFSSECEHMPEGNYTQKYRTRELQASDRQEAIFLISKVAGFDPFVTYLAVNYLDRFISRQEIPKKSWILRLLSISCVSLASKMCKAKCSLSDFQEEGLVFDVRTIRRMELLVLGALKWRMRSVTPFSFINFFFSLSDHDDPSLTADLKARTVETILTTQAEIKFLEFRPSIVAAASLLLASREVSPSCFACNWDALSGCVHINKERLASCYELLQDVIAIEKHEPASHSLSDADTPVGVLDLHCSVSESEKSDSGSATSSGGLATLQLYQAVAATKRQRLDDLCSKVVQASQVHHCPI